MERTSVDVPLIVIMKVKMNT